MAIFGTVFVIPLLLTSLTACAWTPRVMTYPSGLKIVRVDQHEMDTACPINSWDNGEPVGSGEHADGCYSKEKDTIWLLNSCLGAKALPHELAHREGISDPSRDGFDW